ncbi:MAG: ribonuclease III [Candidatus Coatesbacteria bacterium]|nr:ribonuclease III [Candidatus Coatesbacteria bacterium]
MDEDDLYILDAVEEITGHRFGNLELLRKALTHPSYYHENEGCEGHYQRLEYLGDAVLDLAVAEFLYHVDQTGNEGDLTEKRVSMVCGDNLAQRARELELGELLYLGKGERESGGADRDSNLENAFEALFGALFIDAGYHHAARVARELLFEELIEAVDDPKGDLQQYCHRHDITLPTYEVTVEGPDHRRLYRSRALVDGAPCGEGVDTTKKGAEALAAAEALKELRRREREKKKRSRRGGRRRKKRRR